MNPYEVFTAVSLYSGVINTTVCEIKSKCSQFHNCTNKSVSRVLDFDGAAHTYQLEKGESQTKASVDAIAINRSEDVLVLAEKKTWGQFFMYLTGEDKTDPVKSALNKISSYGLKTKYESTRLICEHIVKENDLFLILPHVFVFLTELTDSDPMSGFASDLSQLACTSSTIDFSVQSTVVKGMKKHLATVPCKKSRYLNCMEFDEYLQNPSKFG